MWCVSSPKGGVFLSNDAFSKCHPLTNFIFFLCAIGFAAVVQHPAYLAAGCLWGGIYYVLLKGKKGLAFLLALIPLFFLLSMFNSLFNTMGKTVLFVLFGHPFSLEALCHGMAVSGILIAMLIWFGCYSVVLTSDKFVCLFGSLIPSLSLLLVMILRLIPNLMRRGAQILDVRRSIGKGAGEGSGTKEKLLDGMNVLSAMTDWALEGGIVTADSMRSRGYGCAKRTSFQLYRITAQDVFLLILMALLVTMTLLSNGTAAQFTPSMEITPINGGFYTYCLLLAIPTILQGKETLQWHISISRI